MTLAISAGSFHGTSETFLRRNAQDLAPGQTVLLCHDGRGLDDPSIPVYRYRAPRFPGLGWAGRAPNALLRRLLPGAAVKMGARDRAGAGAFLREHGVTRVLAEYGPEGLLLADLCAELDLPLYVHFHGFDASSDLRNPRLVEHYRRLFPRIAGVIVRSEYMADNLVRIGCPRDIISINPSGVDLDRFSPARSKPGRIVAVGRLVPKKAPQLTIRAFARAAAENPHARLEIIGDGPLMADCKAEIEQHGLADRVTMTGAVDHATVVRAMSDAAIFAQHSIIAPDGDAEGLPNAVLEAMSTALPVVATRHSGIPEAVVDGVTGILVDEHDIEAMGDALSDLLTDPDRAACMGAAGRRRVEEEFPWEVSTGRLRKILGL